MLFIPVLQALRRHVKSDVTNSALSLTTDDLLEAVSQIRPLNLAWKKRYAMWTQSRTPSLQVNDAKPPNLGCANKTPSFSQTAKVETKSVENNQDSAAEKL